MTALNRFFTTPAFIASFILSMWLGFLAAALLLNPIASQTTKVHQLGFFSLYATNLIHPLQLERAASASFVASGQSDLISAQLKEQHEKTDTAYLSFKKQHGRFNSADFGSALSSSLEAAVAQLSRLDKIRSGALKKNADISLTIDAYSKAVEPLITAVSQMERVQLENPVALGSRDAFLKHFKAEALSAREMILAHPAETYTAEWLKTFRQKHRALHGMAVTELRKLMKTVSAEAARRANVFVIYLLIVVIATLITIAWHRPSAFKQSLLITLSVFNIALVAWTLTTGPFWMSKESGPIESLQTIVLVAAFALFCREAVKYPNSTRPAAVTMACLCFLMFFRELDLRILDAPDWLITITSGKTRKALSVSLAVLTCAYVATCYRSVPGLIRSSLTWRAWPFYIWPLLLVLGEKVELRTHATRQDELPGFWANGQFWEELLELNAYLAVFYAAYIFAEIYRSSPKSAGTYWNNQSNKPPPLG